MRRRTIKHKLLKLNKRMSRTFETMPRNVKHGILLLVDIMLVPIACAMLIFVAEGNFREKLALVVVLTVAGGAASLIMGLPRIKLKTYEQNGIQRTAGYGAIVGIVGFIGSKLLYGTVADPIFILNVTMAIVILSVAARFIMRNILIAIYTRGHDRQRVLIYGAGQTGVQLAAALDKDDIIEPVAFIDDNPTLQKILVAGLPVHSPVRIEQIIKTLRVDRVVLAMPTQSRPRQARLIKYLQSLDCEVSALPSFASLVGETRLTDKLLPINPTDFLNRADLDADLEGSCEIYAGSCVMITGAGGSIGSELARQVINCRPKCLVLFDVSEHALYQLDRELNESSSDDEICPIIPVLGSVTDALHVRRTIAEHGVNTVLHAAAYKHVPMVEKNRLVGLYNNVIGTQTVAKAAGDAGVDSFILVSTDKAVQPTNIMGASKRLAELLVQDISTRTPQTRFSIVRFGNVLGSSGSVIPLFDEQIARGGPVTLTHAEVTRYFMTISEAARLVLMVGSQAQKTDQHGEIFVLDMGEPVSIRALACQMIEAAGYTVCDAENPDGDIEIQECGLRPGEKLHEILTVEGKPITDTDHPKIKRVQEDRLAEIEIASALRALNEAFVEGDEDIAVDMLRRWVKRPALEHEGSSSALASF
ncbi:polysaccharide biosynthesis protein [Octadecabacter sp. CECT 8868]|uniref:polysaccharide biosynthesis protein n=1 Tax=Octadecabacter algicola TaxID=2909342 RepID=UPI001F3E7710|nr:nucleoside-diphosphate sugar epimerase/dehydratase [Octadecabacter algicola]MCF2903355.1 polysaccharide biosynthesis protein [Octadecabacter algicola]